MPPIENVFWDCEKSVYLQGLAMAGAAALERSFSWWLWTSACQLKWEKARSILLLCYILLCIYLNLLLLIYLKIYFGINC